MASWVSEKFKNRILNFKQRYQRLTFWKKLVVCGAVVFITGLIIGLIKTNLSISKSYIGVHIDIRQFLEKIEQNKTKNTDQLLLSKTFWLLHEKNAGIELGPCPSDYCFKFVLDELILQNKQLIQRIYITGKGFGIHFNPKSGAIIQSHALAGFKGAGPVFNITDSKMFVSFNLKPAQP